MDELFVATKNEQDLGTCCACEGVENVRNIMTLHLKAPKPGTGWGCVVCALPFDGAIAVVCDKCLDDQTEIRFAVDGYASQKKRIPIDQLRGHMTTIAASIMSCTELRSPCLFY